MTAEQKLVEIQGVVNRHFTPDPYYAGKVAHIMKVDSAVHSMSRIREILQREEPQNETID